MKKIFLGMLVCLLSFVSANAQIGYQVSLLNSATGEPRANETVSADIVITDAQDKTVYSTTQSATTNDFGVLSFVVGDADTFKDVAVGRLPLYISVTVGGTLIGKSQILSVPVAEVAKTLKSNFTLEELCKTWVLEEWYDPVYGHRKVTITFYTNNTWKYEYAQTQALYFNDEIRIETGSYEIEGNNIYLYRDDAYDSSRILVSCYRIYDSKLYITTSGF